MEQVHEKVKWSCRVVPKQDGWRWHAQAPGFMGVSGDADSPEDAETQCRSACVRATLARRETAAKTRHFSIEV